MTHNSKLKYPEPMGGMPTLQQLEQARRSGELGRLGVEHIAKTVHLPVASARGLLSWYTDLHADAQSIGVCRGTSCMLAGADDLSLRLKQKQPCRDVYCVGYCDRSPVVLMPDNRAIIHCRVDDCDKVLNSQPRSRENGLPLRPPPPDVWCTARTPVVTSRLKGHGCANLSAAQALGVYQSLEQALRGSPEQILLAVEQSGIRGRGGAGFPTGRKWRACARAAGDRKYVIANGDEGDPGSFIDRELMERDPHSILEGMILAAFAVNATEGIVFIRSEYPGAIAVMQHAIEQARSAQLLGPSVCGTNFGFDVRVVTGLGSYVCGEETAMLNAIEGKRGEARPRPPFPAEHGLFAQPTVVDNVETLVNIPWIMRSGAAAYRAMGTDASPGTIALCLNHGFARPGIVEVEFGVSLRSVINELAGGAAPNTTLEAVLLGGPMGSVVRTADFDVPVCIDAMTQRGIRLGHGGIVALPHGTDYARLLRHLLEFMAHESCGKCVPCRIGSRRALELAGGNGLTSQSAASLADLFHLMEMTSLCGFGREAPGPVRQLIEYFGPRILTGVGR